MPSLPNSDVSNPLPELLSPPLGLSTTQPPSQLNPSLLAASEWKEAPLEALLEMEEKTLVHEMEPLQLAAYIQRCATLRQSAQSRKAAATTEKSVPKKTVKKDSVAEAMDMLKKLGLA